MKKLILLLFISIISVSAQTMLPCMEKQTPEFKKYLIDHTIFTIWETQANCLKSFDTPGDPLGESFYEFDGNGNLLKAIYKAPQMQVVSIDSFVYDQKFVLKTVVSYDLVNVYAEGKGSKTIREVSYDNAGRFSKIKIYSLTGNKREDLGYYEYEYNQDGTIKKVSDRTKFNIYGEAMPQTDYFYANGKLIKEESAVRTAEHEYDAAGRKIRTVESLEGNDGYTLEYLYDKSGNLIEERSSGLMTKGSTLYEYDFEGKLKYKKESFSISGDTPSLTLTEYFYNFQME